MPFEIVRNDITNMQVDAIVNTANPQPVIGSGTDAAVHARAGRLLLMARRRVGVLAVGEAAITPGFRLPAKYVIHTVGPIWVDGTRGEAEQLRRCYENALELARRKRLRSVAFPLISTGNYGFPKPLALEIATDVIRRFLAVCEMQVYLVVFSRDSFRLSTQLQRDIRSYIDERYVREQTLREYSFDVLEDFAPVERTISAPACLPCEACPEEWEDGDEMEEPAPRRLRPSLSRKPVYPGAAAPKPAQSLSQMMQQLDAGFSETLLRLIDGTGKKDSQIYRRANVSRQHFSKIRNNPHYQPTKSTALAFAIALELDLAQTRDLIGRAGFALTCSSKSDLIIMYFIEQGNYNIIDINAALFEFDQSLLGA